MEASAWESPASNPKWAESAEGGSLFPSATEILLSFSQPAMNGASRRGWLERVRVEACCN